MLDIDIEIVIIFSFLFITINSCKEKNNISKYNYYIAKINTYISTILSTSKLIGAYTLDCKGSSTIDGQDTIQNIRYENT